MASFSLAIENTKKNEGGFYDDPTAGWTYAGITKKFYKDWPGFRILAELQQTIYMGRPIPRYTVFPRHEQLNIWVNDFYKKKFWPRTNGEYITNQTIANFFFDFLVHKEGVAIPLANKVAKTLQPNISTEKGKLGIRVIELINNYPTEFYKAYRQARIDYYNSGIFSKARARQFVERAKKFPETVYS